MNKKHYLALAVVAALGLGVAGNVLVDHLEEASARQQEEEYMEWLIKVLNNPRGIISFARDIRFELPRFPQRVQWDEEYEMPQVMFVVDGSLWSANFNGSNPQLMVHSDEMTRGVVQNGSNRPSRSPNGRYLLYSNHRQCFAYDLKEQTQQIIGDYPCRSIVWSRTQPYGFMFNYGILRFNYETGAFERGEEINAKVTRDNNGSYYDHKLERYLTFVTTSASEGGFRVFDPETLDLIEQSDHFAEGCSLSIRYSLDQNTYTCGLTSESGQTQIFDATERNKKVGLVPEGAGSVILQNNQLYFNGTRMLRRLPKNVITPIDSMRHAYVSDYHAVDFYLSENLFNNFAQQDFDQYLWPWPTQAQIDEAKRRIAQMEDNG
ncbi:hypothetical protein [Vibrio sp. WXL210]|uniref:hypothetical protein n=1 Tax=Vibrio sp. WXL210 TaxID=3450709 RepID=UPI003EC87844